MSELQAIHLALERTARRRRWARALRGLWVGLLAGAFAALLILIAYKLFPLPIQWLAWAGALPVAGALAGAVVGGWRKRPLPEVARWVDEHAHLQERLSTALEVLPDTPGDRWGELILKDAAAHINNIDPRRMIPLHVTNAARLAALTLLLCAVLGFVPERRSETYLRQQTDAGNIQETGRRIAEFSRRSLERRAPAVAATRTTMETAIDLGTDLQKQTLTRTEAMREISAAAEKIRARAEELSKDPAIQQLRRAAQSSGGEQQSRAALQKQIDSLKNQLGSATNPEQIDKLKSQLSKLDQAAKAMTSGNPSTEDRQKMGAALSELSRQAQAMGLDLPDLDAAIEALAAQQTDLFLKHLEASLTDLEKLSQMAKTLQALQQQADKLGKDLAEQLQRGQAESARETLTRLAKNLQNSGLSQEQMKQILEEVQKAVSPAQNYGKVAEHLKAAASQMGSGNQAGASQSLLAAAKELESLMEQFGDAQMLMATLDALKNASLCLGTGQCWGFRPGRGGDNKPGVGTWADDSKEWDGKASEMVDNSGFERPDMDSRSGEADPEQGSSLTPTKVRGQFSPGGQMPSISLRGVGIKGESTVAYEQAAEAAQSQAEASLSQDKVPRAYRETVKNYFDELKQ